MDVGAHVSLLITTTVSLPLSFYGPPPGPRHCGMVVFSICWHPQQQHHRAAFLPADNTGEAEWTLRSRLHAAARGGPTPKRLFSCNQTNSAFQRMSLTNAGPEVCLNRETWHFALNPPPLIFTSKALMPFVLLLVCCELAAWTKCHLASCYIWHIISRQALFCSFPVPESLLQLRYLSLPRVDM